MDGIINVLKPTGMTSHDVVSFIRKTINQKKVGHTGTLDPNAAGVLPICVGKATKVSQYLLDKRKRYRAELTLGNETDTQDKYGKVLRQSDVNVTETDIINAFKKFKGNIKQVPPMFSALKVKGKKLYELAREGKTIERKPRDVTIYELNIINICQNRIIFDVECSKGTYIRTLCNDIGNELGTYGYMSMLIRTRTGNFDLDNSHTLDKIKDKAENNDINSILKPLDFVLYEYKAFNIEDRHYGILSNGGRTAVDERRIKENNIELNEKIRVYCMNKFIGIGVLSIYGNNYYVKMDKVLL